MTDQNLIGKEGEEEARNYLVKQEYIIYHTNWHFRHYELDIVATKDDELVIVEVKTRSDGYLIAPEDAVDRGKIKRIVAAADVYARYFRINMPVRFDIITLIKNDDGYEIEHIEDAFYAPLRRR
ncbi:MULTISPECIES: YraN family protein [unclassified Parabacteroides]|uniref:YraN family protein n=1 Tax=unclassified Parabacteroides TaxID=2649774 RepID=UPI002475E8B2|nr:MULTISPECIES: YraN family protein [unclassified Parabacteroides]